MAYCLKKQGILSLLFQKEIGQNLKLQFSHNLAGILSFTKPQGIPRFGRYFPDSREIPSLNIAVK